MNAREAYDNTVKNIAKNSVMDMILKESNNGAFHTHVTYLPAATRAWLIEQGFVTMGTLITWNKPVMDKLKKEV